MQIELGAVEVANLEEMRFAISTASHTATIRAFSALFVADKNFRDDVIAAFTRRNVDKNGRLTK